MYNYNNYNYDQPVECGLCHANDKPLNDNGLCKACEQAIHAVCCHAGIYGPQEFIQRYSKSLKGDGYNSLNEDIAILEEGPEHPEYWDAWDEITTNCRVVDENGKEYYIHHDGDIWLIPIEE